MSFLSIHQLSKSFSTQCVLQKINLSINMGEFLVVLGKSGSGKTTLLRLIAGFEKVDEGSIILNERTLSSPHYHVSAEKRNIGIVFQDHALWPHMSVFENVAFPLQIQKKSSADIQTRVHHTLHSVNMEWASRKYPHQLSGGEAQRVALARTLIQDPSLIIFDEPLASLDAVLRHEIQGVIKSLHNEKKFTALYITHDQHEAMRLGHRLAILNQGIIEQCDTPQHLYHHPKNESVAMLCGSGCVIPVEQLKEVITLNESSPVFQAIHQTYKKLHDLPTSSCLFIRPENVMVSDNSTLISDQKDALILEAIVHECYFSHGLYHINLHLFGQHIIMAHASHFFEKGSRVTCSITRYITLPL